MDNEKILLDLFKQQQIGKSNASLQKVFLTVIGAGSALAMIGSIVFFAGWLYSIAFGCMVFCISVVTLFVKLERLRLKTACLIAILFSCFVFIPPFWIITGITGIAPYLSIIILLSVVFLYTGTPLKILLFSYLTVLAGLVVYSEVISLPETDDAYMHAYTIAGFLSAVGTIVLYMIFKQREVARLNDTFLLASFRDELTHLYNRKLLDLMIHHQETQYRQSGNDYVFVLFDVDDFKAMNDEHGQVFGDIVLRSIAACIQNTTRTSDFVVRTGGDEILVIQANASESSVEPYISRIQTHMKTSCQLETKLSVSYGYALRSEGATPQEVLQLADERLSKQKTLKKTDA